MFRFNQYCSDCLGSISMSPLSLVALVHLGLQKSPECAIDGPSNSISLAHSAFDNNFALKHLVNVDPNALSQYFLCNLVSLCVLLNLSPWRMAPVSITASMSMLLPGTGAYCQLRVALDSLHLLNAEDLVWSVEILEQNLRRRPLYLLGSSRLS